MKTITEKLEEIKQVTDQGHAFWSGRELMPVLGYRQWRNFTNAIDRAIEAFRVAGARVDNHFAEASKMVPIGSDAKRPVEDLFLSRAACYIIAMCGDTRIHEVAKAQQYFAVQTRRMERIQRVLLDQRRVSLRLRLQHNNRNLSNVAQDAGVKRFAIFHGAGIRAMYDMRLKDLKKTRRLSERDDWLDHQGIEELVANDFRVTQTTAKIERERVRGEQAAIETHKSVGREVRSTIRRLGNALPENLPVEPPIGDIRKRLKPGTDNPAPTSQ